MDSKFCEEDSDSSIDGNDLPVLGRRNRKMSPDSDEVVLDFDMYCSMGKKMKADEECFIKNP